MFFGIPLFLFLGKNLCLCNQISTVIDEGHLIVFDRTQEKTWDERIWHKPYEYSGRTIMVWGM